MRPSDVLRVLLGLLALIPACGSAGGGEQTEAGPGGPGGLVLVVDPASLSFTVEAGGAAPAGRRIVVRYDGEGGPSTWQVASSPPWAGAEPPSGSDGDATVVSIDATALAVGRHEGALLFEDPAATNTPLRVPLTLEVTTASPAPACGCASLPAPTGAVVEISTAAELANAVRDANDAGGSRTLLLADGTYQLTQLLHVTAPDVTVRSASGSRDGVVLRGGGMTGSVAHVFLVAGKRFTAADLTLGWVRYHGIQVQGEQDADDVLVHNVRFVDTGEQMLKVSFDASGPATGDRGIVRCCLFEYTAGIGPQYYIGGVDCHRGDSWVVRHNVFRGIRSPEARLAEHAIHFWNEARGTLVEGNVIYDCDRGIGFGLGSSGHHGGVIRNNMVQTTRDVGIGLENAPDTQVLHNSVCALNYQNAIEYRFAGTTGVSIAGNLTYGAITARDGAAGAIGTNGAVLVPNDVFVNPAAGDLHLRTARTDIVDRGEAPSAVAADLDCDERPQGPASDLGADEWKGP